MSKESCRAWYQRNKVYRYWYMKIYRSKNPKYRLKNKLNLRRRKVLSPWLSHYDCARTRCLNPNVKCFHRYGARGIKFLLTQEHVRKLWFRYKAFNLKKPTLDRVNNDGHYQLSNCRFIEKSINSTKGNYEARWKR